MSPLLGFLGFIIVLVVLGGIFSIPSMVREGGRKARLEARRYRAGLVTAEHALRSIANGSADPQNEASIALYDIERKLYNELEK
jgi:hypothetical protein